MERLNNVRVEKLTVSLDKLFKAFMTRCVKNDDLIVELQWGLNNMGVTKIYFEHHIKSLCSVFSQV